MLQKQNVPLGGGLQVSREEVHVSTHLSPPPNCGLLLNTKVMLLQPVAVMPVDIIKATTSTGAFAAVWKEAVAKVQYAIEQVSSSSI
eukprot:SAG22_NODE_3013_length_2027_cov_2.443465_2_plen_87_part_00